MNKKIFVVMMFVLWGGLGMTPGVWAQPTDGPEGGFFEEGSQAEDPGDQGRLVQRRKQHFEEMAKELNLTDDQRKQIESHRQEHMQEIKTLSHYSESSTGEDLRIRALSLNIFRICPIF